MSKHGERHDPSVLCPYYICETQKGIKCAGVEEGTALRMTFAESWHKRAYHDMRCCGQYGKCRIARMLDAEYDAQHMGD